MSTTQASSNGNVGARIKPKYGRDLFLYRDQPDGHRMTLYLTFDEAERLAESLDELLDANGR